MNHKLLIHGGAALSVCLWGAAATMALAQFDQYPATEERYADPSRGGAPGPTAFGPYDDYRQQHDIRPDFSSPAAPIAPQPKLFSPGQQIAIVGKESILAGDFLGDINQMLQPYEGKAPPEELDKQRLALMQRMLTQAIQTKMLYQEMLETVPKEARPEIEHKLAEEFDKRQLPDLIDRAKVNSAAELDAKLREFGSSVEKQRRLFGEQVLAREYLRQKINREPEVSHTEMVAYYRENLPDFERPARVRWEELAVNYSDYPDKAEAYRAIAAMGNRVLRGAAFSRVAREASKGATASDGGWYDWTTKGSLRATQLDEAIFALPVDELSQIIETDDGFHIIRVLDREEEGRAPFFQEQVRIKSKIQAQMREKEADAFIAGVRRKYRVWTIFDDGLAQAADDTTTE